MLMQDVVEAVGTDSKVIRALKLVQQNLVLYCISILKSTVCSGMLTKDVRTPNGWRILVMVGENVQVRARL
jgi:hypothetical protein